MHADVGLVGSAYPPLVQALLDRVESHRMTDLDDLPPVARLRDVTRGGLRTVAASAAALGTERVRDLVEYRVAQYLQVNFVDIHQLEDALGAVRLLDNTSPNDIHVVAVRDDGMVMCTAVLTSIAGEFDTTRMRERERRLFPVELVHGAGIFDRLRVLPDLAVARVRQFGGFVKRQELAPHAELAIRAPLEVCAAVFRVVTGPMALTVQAVIGDLEETVAKLNLEFFGAEPVLIRGSVPAAPKTSYLGPRYEGRAVCPFALFVSDSGHAIPRLREIEEALAKPGTHAVLALRHTARNSSRGWSTLSPETPDEVQGGGRTWRSRGT